MKKTLSVVIPVYNSENSIERLVHAVIRELGQIVELELVLVNDGSRDSSWSKLQMLARQFPGQVVAINLGKNFGEHNAVMAGYHHAKGDYIANIDDDFQNPPSELLKLLAKMDEGHDVVYSRYEHKKHDWWRNWGSRFNDWMASLLLKKPKNLYLSSFRMISRQLKQEVVKYQGPYPYIDGLILRSTSHIGTVLVTHNARHEGQSNYTITKLLRLWSHAFLNFSVIPLRFAAVLGLIFACLGLLGVIWVLAEKFFNPNLQMGWPSLIVTILILSGTQLLILGVLGEYVGRIFISQSAAPQFVIRDVQKGS